MLPKISVIIPVYNVEKYLRQCMDSIISQTFKDFECICVNDGSTDGSLDILQEYAKKDDRIKIITQENKGLPAARNVGIKKSIGQYLVFVDSDDFIVQNCLETAFNKIIETSADIVEFNYKFYYFKENRYESKIFPDSQKIKKDDTIGTILQKSYEDTAWRRIYKKEFLLKNNLFFYEGRVSEDGVFAAMLFLYTKNIVYIEDELYIYRKQRTTAITSNLSKLFVDWFYNFFTLIKDMKNRGLLSEEAIKWCIHVFCWDYSRIGKQQPKDIQKEMLTHGINITGFLLESTNSLVNKIRLKLLFLILKLFKLHSYRIVRVFKNLV